MASSTLPARHGRTVITARLPDGPAPQLEANGASICHAPPPPFPTNTDQVGFPVPFRRIYPHTRFGSASECYVWVKLPVGRRGGSVEKRSLSPRQARHPFQICEPAQTHSETPPPPPPPPLHPFSHPCLGGTRANNKESKKDTGIRSAGCGAISGQKQQSMDGVSSTRRWPRPSASRTPRRRGW